MNKKLIPYYISSFAKIGAVLLAIYLSIQIPNDLTIPIPVNIMLVLLIILAWRTELVIVELLPEVKDQMEVFFNEKDL